MFALYLRNHVKCRTARHHTKRQLLLTKIKNCNFPVSNSLIEKEKQNNYAIYSVLKVKYSDTSANEDNSFRNHIR